MGVDQYAKDFILIFFAIRKWKTFLGETSQSTFSCSVNLLSQSVEFIKLFGLRARDG